MAEAADTITVGELRQQCEAKEHAVEEVAVSQQGAVEKRISAEQKVVNRPFAILPHRPNYILPLVFNGQGYDASSHRAANGDAGYSFDDVEAQFQISLKTPLVQRVFGTQGDIYAAYTNHSFWQVYNGKNSAPFRETNHEPEIWLQFTPKWSFMGIANTYNAFGYNHQSNGQSGVLSRSWNRLFATFVVERGNLALSLTPWYRIPESSGNDDNPDITRFLGNYELGASYTWGDHTFALLSRNLFESDFKRASFQFSWSFPLGDWPYLRGYVQYFNGFGESLLDYNHRVNRIGLGFSLTDWL